MKKINLIIAFLACFSFAHAQVIQVEIAEKEASMSQGLNPACVVTLENTSEKNAEKSWSKYMKKYGSKTKKVRKSDDYLTDDATIPGMSNNTVDVYATFSEIGDNVEMSVWYDLGGAYLTSATHAERFAAAQTMLNEFANVIAKQSVEEELSMQEKALKSMNGDLKSLQKKKDDLEDDIKKYEKKIEEAKAAIEQNLVDQENKTAAIQNQEKMVEEVKGRLKEFN